MPGRPTLWLAFLGGPVAWSAHLLASYPLVPLACESGSTMALNLVTVAMLTLAGASAAAGAWGLRRLGRTSGGGSTAAPPGPAGTGGGSLSAEAAVRRARFMARFGLWSGLFFMLVIAVEGLPPLLQHPCLSVG